MLDSRPPRSKQAVLGPLSSVLIFLVATALVGCDGISDPETDPEFSKEVETETLDTGAVSLEEIDQGQYGAIADGTREVLQDQEAYTAFWRQLHAGETSVPDPPEVNFDAQIVVAVVLGQRPTGGYSVEVDEVLTTESGSPVQVQYTERIPGDGCVVQQVLTSPYVLATIETQGGEVTFSGSEDTFSC
jgi:hypothetical protein